MHNATGEARSLPRHLHPVVGGSLVSSEDREWTLLPEAVYVFESGLRQHSQVVGKGGGLIFFHWFIVEHDRHILEFLIVLRGACQLLRLLPNAFLPVLLVECCSAIRHGLHDVGYDDSPGGGELSRRPPDIGPPFPHRRSDEWLATR